MELFPRIGDEGHEQVVFCSDAPSGLRAIIAIHSTALGPSLGGTRFKAYAREEDALEDVLRLSRAMTYKAAAAGLDLGGGKAVIVGDPATQKTEALLRAYGRFVDSLGGRYVTAEDVGTTQADMDMIRRETRWATGVSESLGGSGDPSPATAVGVHHAMRAVAAHLWGHDDLAGRTVCVSGVGKVGFALAAALAKAGAKVLVADVSEAAVSRAVDELGAEAVPAEKAHAAECDIFSPCALGGVLNGATIGEMTCSAVVGAANNQLAEPEDAERLAQAGIAYAPDFIVNAGGIMNIAEELAGYDRARAYDGLRRIFDSTTSVLATAKSEGITTESAAERVAERRLAEVSRVQLIRRGGAQR